MSHPARANRPRRTRPARAAARRAAAARASARRSRRSRDRRRPRPHHEELGAPRARGLLAGKAVEDRDADEVRRPRVKRSAQSGWSGPQSCTECGFVRCGRRPVPGLGTLRPRQQHEGVVESSHASKTCRARAEANSPLHFCRLIALPAVSPGATALSARSSRRRRLCFSKSGLKPVTAPVLQRQRRSAWLGQLRRSWPRSLEPESVAPAPVSNAMAQERGLRPGRARCDSGTPGTRSLSRFPFIREGRDAVEVIAGSVAARFGPMSPGKQRPRQPRPVL